MPKSYQGDFKIFSGDSGLWVFLGQASPRKKNASAAAKERHNI